MKISVVVPIYGVEKYLPKLLDSILVQSIKDFELLLVDDGSKDNSGKICDEYAMKDSRIKVFHKENGGVSSARNYGIKHSRGEYLYFADGDDELLPDCLEVLLSGIDNHHDVDLAIGGYFYSSNGALRKPKPVPNIEQLFNRNEITEEALHPKYYPLGMPWNNLFKKSIIVENNLLFHNNVFEDRVFFISYLCHIKGKIYHTTTPVYIYNINIGVMSQILKSSQKDMRNKTIFEAQCQIYEMVRDNNFSKRANWWARHIMINSYVHKKKYFEEYSDNETLCTMNSIFLKLTNKQHLYRFYLRENLKKIITPILFIIRKIRNTFIKN